MADDTPGPGTYVISKRGPNSRTWQSVTTTTNQAGRIRSFTNSYQEICTGVAYLDTKTGQYVDSAEQIDLLPDGSASASHGRHKTIFQGNANTAGGSVTLTTPDNKTLTSRVYGLCMIDRSTGSNVIVAELKDSQGTINGNQVVWQDAFTDFKCDIVDTWTFAGFSQNIVLREAPPDPVATYGFNLNTTWLEIYTEFINPPQPQITSQTNQNIISDNILDFGDMKIGIGSAFSVQGQGSQSGLGVVNKRWCSIDNRQFLIESIPFTAITNSISQLPQHSSSGNPGDKVRHIASAKPFSPKKVMGTKHRGTFKRERLASRGSALDIDYTLLSGETNFLFKSDTTYFVSGLCNLLGTNTLEGGVVIKYTNNATAEIQVTNLVCQNAPYRPAIFTSMNDNSIGNNITGSTGNPWSDNSLGAKMMRDNFNNNGC